MKISLNMLNHTSQRDLFRILFALLCFCLQVPGTFESHILQVEPPSIVVRFGSQASVTCSTNVTHKGMGWEASQGAVDKMENVNVINWTVESVTHWDIKPICYINTDEQYEVPLNITVYKPPDWVSITTVNHTEPMTEGTQYELRCDVQNVAPVPLLNVNWYKGKQLVKNESFPFKNEPAKDLFPANQTSTLQIFPHRSDNGVQYRCEAELQLGPEGPQPPPVMTSDPLNITVYFGPEISNCPDVLQLSEGKSLEGYCNVNGKPFPISHWEKDGRIIDPTLPLTRTSRGEYKIIVNKKTILKSLKVEVMYGPEISCYILSYEVKEGEDFEPNCTVVGYPPASWSWHKDGDVVDFPQKMLRRDAGQYTLTASINNSTISRTLEIGVLYPPSEITELEDADVSFGEGVVLKCSSNAKPRPTYQWIYHRTANVHVTDQDGVSLLHIKQANGNNIGTYECIAKNDLGKTNQKVRVDVRGTTAACPLLIQPQPVELEYNKSISVTCKSNSSDATLSWKISDKVYNGSTLVINSDWFINNVGWTGVASCHGHFVGLNDCHKNVNVTIYKRPDQVSISTVGHAGPMIEGKTYTLQCDIQNVAPVQLLTVNWYKGQDQVKNQSFTVFESITNITTRLNISPSRNNTKMQYSCEAVLKLGPKNSLKVKSDPLYITVHSKPAIRDKLQRRVPVFRGYPTVLICEASGNPEPTITWFSNNERFAGGNLTVPEKSGEYTCIATNSVGNDSRVVAVDLKEDYLPLIAGFVALVVVIISVFFLSIYSIYYKNTKMGHYTVEGAKPKAQNGNIAQNGKDSTIPMKKIMV